MLLRVLGKESLRSLFVEMQIGVATPEISTENSQKIEINLPDIQLYRSLACVKDLTFSSTDACSVMIIATLK